MRLRSLPLLLIAALIGCLSMNPPASAQGIRPHEIGMDSSEVIASRISGALFSGATRGIINGIKSTRAKPRPSPPRTTKPNPVRGELMNLVAYLNQTPSRPPRLGDAAIIQGALSGIIADASTAAQSYQTLISSSRSLESELTNPTALLNDMVTIVDRSSWQLRSHRGNGRGRATGQMQYTRSGLPAMAQVDLVATPAGWIIRDIHLPSEHLTLTQWVQYRMIEATPYSPELQSMMQPGRSSQSEAVTAVLALDAHTKAFADGYGNLSEAARSWPLTQFKAALHDHLFQGRSLSASQMQQLIAGGVSQHSLRWLNQLHPMTNPAAPATATATATAKRPRPSQPTRRR